MDSPHRMIADEYFAHHGSLRGSPSLSRQGVATASGCGVPAGIAFPFRGRWQPEGLTEEVPSRQGAATASGCGAPAGIAFPFRGRWQPEGLTEEVNEALYYLSQQAVWQRDDTSSASHEAPSPEGEGRATEVTLPSGFTATFPRRAPRRTQPGRKHHFGKPC